MVSEEVIVKRLERLEESIKRLKSKENVSLVEFEKNWELQNAIKNFSKEKREENLK